MIQTLIIVALAFHLLSMNLASALPLFAIVAQFLGHREDPAASLAAARRCVRISIHSLLGGILLGLVAAGLMWVAGERAFFDVLPRFLYKIHWGIAELVFSIICLGLYLYSLPSTGPLKSGRQWWLATLALLSATNLLYHFPPLFTTIRMVADAPAKFPEQIGAKEFRAIWTTSHAVPMLVHFALASIAASGIYLWLHLTRSTTATEPLARPTRRLAQTSVAIALSVTAAQLLVGIWLLLSVPVLTQHRLMGNDLVGTLSLLTSIMLAFGLMHHLSAAAFGNLDSKQAKRSMLLLVAIVIAMTATLID